MYEKIIFAGSVCGAITAVIAFVVAFLKPVRKWCVERVKKIAHSEESEKENKKTRELLEQFIKDTKEWQQKIEKRMEEDRETDIVQLRNTINEIYDENCAAKHLTIRQKERLIDTFEQYDKIGGNHNAREKYNEMMTWDVSW